MHRHYATQSAFTIPDVLPELDMQDKGREWKDCIVVLLVITGGILSFVSLSAFYLDWYSGVRWAIIMEVGATLITLSSPLLEVILIKMSKQTTSMDLLISSLNDITWSLSLSVMSGIILTIFPTSYLKNYSINLWSFGLSNLIFLVTIYRNFVLVGQVCVMITKRYYLGGKLSLKMKATLNDLVSIFILSKVSREGSNGNQDKLWKWTRLAILWGTPPCEAILKNRLISATNQSRQCDLYFLSDRIWRGYLNVRIVDPTIQWVDYLCSIIRCDFKGGQNEAKLKTSKIHSMDDLLKEIQEITTTSQETLAEMERNDGLFDQLKFIFNIVAFIILSVVVLPMMGFSPDEMLRAFGLSIVPTMMALTVISNQTVSTLVASISFILITHPFDVNDNIKIKGEFLTIKSIGFIHCTLQNVSGMTLYYPNSVLSQMEVENVSRAEGNMQKMEIIVPGVNGHTLQEILREMKDYVIKSRAFCMELTPIGVRIIVIKSREIDDKSLNLLLVKQYFLSVIWSSLQEKKFTFPTQIITIDTLQSSE